MRRKNVDHPITIFEMLHNKTIGADNNDSLTTHTQHDSTDRAAFLDVPRLLDEHAVAPMHHRYFAL